MRKTDVGVFCCSVRTQLRVRSRQTFFGWQEANVCKRVVLWYKQGLKWHCLVMDKNRKQFFVYNNLTANLEDKDCEIG